MESKRKGMSKEAKEARWKVIVDYIKSKDTDFSKNISGQIIEKRRTMRNYEAYRSRKILKFQKKGFETLKGVRAWVEKEMEEIGLPETRSEPDEATKTNDDRPPVKVTNKKKCSQFKAHSTSPGTLPVRIHRAILGLGGTAPLWLAFKALTYSDINPGQGRLLMPRCDEAWQEVLTSKERKSVVVTENKKDCGLIVKVVDPNGEVWDLDFKYWKSFEGFVLTGKNWNRLVVENSLDPETDMVHVWCFRSSPSAQLGFAIHIERS